MRHPRLFVLLLGVTITVALAATAARANADATDFRGYADLRVVEQTGKPWRLRPNDLDGDGRDEVVVVNLRNARLDIYRWRDASDVRNGSGDTPAARATPNELPMAPELQHTEVPLSQAPIDATSADLDGDGVAELYVLAADPNRIIRLVRAAPDPATGWVRDRAWDLLPGGYAGAGRLLRLVPSAGDGAPPSALVSTHDGLQRIALHEGGRAAWLQPREARSRNNWWLVDLDADGDEDLVEWSGDAAQTLRWWPQAADGAFQPPQPLHDRPVADVEPLNGGLLVLESSPRGVVRRYTLHDTPNETLGQRELLPLPGGADAVWAIDTVDGAPLLVALDDATPRLLTFTHGPEGWSAGSDFATLSGVTRLVARPGGGLLLRRADDAVLYATAFENGRYAFPAPVSSGSGPGAAPHEANAGNDNTPETEQLGLSDIAGRVVQITKHGATLRVTHHHTGTHPQATDHPDTAGKADAAKWMGSAGLLVHDKFGRGLRHVTGRGSTSPAALAKTGLKEFRLIPVPATDGNDAADVLLRPARLTNGVLQWMNDDLVATDQVMLPNGRGLIDLVMTAAGAAWALESGGEKIHRLQADAAGILRVTDSHRVHDGRSLTLDPRLGLLLTTGQGLVRLSEGQRKQLDVVQSIDARSGRPASARDATVHRVAAVDLTGDGRQEALLLDDLTHEITALRSSAEGEDGYTPLVSWQVYENQAYPYGGGGQGVEQEPRAVAPLDLNGDGAPDLVMLAQDRLVIYLGKATPQ